jgi:ribosome-associated protein
MADEDSIDRRSEPRRCGAQTRRIMIEINESLSIGENEIEFVFSPSSKPGGQKVNKASTRVTLVFDVGTSPSLSADQRRRIKQRLRGRLTKDGMLRVVSQQHRSQYANRQAATERFARLLGEALKKTPRRKRTSVPPEAQEQRLREKKRRSLLKSSRSGVPDIND